MPKTPAGAVASGCMGMSRGMCMCICACVHVHARVRALAHTYVSAFYWTIPDTTIHYWYCALESLHMSLQLWLVLVFGDCEPPVASAMIFV